jgi:hypothetical protein
MQKWDYLYIVLDSENKYDRERLRYVIRYVNGKELPNWKQGPNVHSVMNLLQRKGWEQIPYSLGYPPKMPFTWRSMMFRRPKVQ